MEMETNGQEVSAASQGITLVAKFGKERITLEDLPQITTIGEVKMMLSEQTNILPKRQKLIGLSANGGGKVTDDVLVKDLKNKNSKKSAGAMQFILMGTPEEHIFVDPHEKDDLPDVIDDFDLDFNAGSEEVSMPCFLLFEVMVYAALASLTILLYHHTVGSPCRCRSESQKVYRSYCCACYE